MTPREENEALAIWAGIECRCKTTHPFRPEGSDQYENCPRHSNGGIPPDYDRDEVAVSLMNLLVEKGYNPTLEYVRLEPVDREPSYWWCGVWKDGKPVNDGQAAPTIAAAIKASILALLEKEKI